MLDFARTVLKTEADAIRNLIPTLDENFIIAVEKILGCKGRVVVTGMGKSGIIGKKIAATLASTGTPSLFMHPADAIHGDLGMIMKGDIVIALSHSGETAEILNLLKTLHRIDITLISMVGNVNSKLAANSDVVLKVIIDHEACPLDLAPSASTTASLAMGDALALVLLKQRGFSEEDFIRFHPGGKLGKKLMKVQELMISGDNLPLISVNTLMKDAIYEISSKGLGVTLVADENNLIVGIITDGDLRRAIEKDPLMLQKKSEIFMTLNPKSVKKDELVIHCVKVMDKMRITALAVTDNNNHPIGVLKIQDIINQGVI